MTVMRSCVRGNCLLILTIAACDDAVGDGEMALQVSSGRLTQHRLPDALRERRAERGRRHHDVCPVGDHSVRGREPEHGPRRRG